MAGNHVQLSRRLKAIADMVTEGNRLVDVGCDHGYLPVYLMLNHKIPGAIATDVGKGPLARAQEHIAEYGMSKYIEAKMCIRDRWHSACNRCASYDHKRKLCAVCDIALRFSAWNAGTL